MSNHENEDTARRSTVLRKLYQATALCSCFIVVEVAGGIFSGSLAILSDAAHLLADMAGLMVAIAASYLASLPATRQHTFGLKRTESLAALFSMVSLAFVSVGLAYEAVHRLVAPPEDNVDGPLMTGIAAIGVLVNLLLAAVLGEDHVHMPGYDGNGHDHSHGHEHGHRHGHDDHEPHEEEEVAEQVSHSHSHNHHETTSKAQHNHDPSEAKKLLDHGHGHQHCHETFVEKDNPVGGLHSDELPPPQHDKRNVNLRAAYLHVMADLAQSVAVLIGGLVIWVKPQRDVVDPILTLLFCILVLWGALGVVRTSMAVLLEEIPPTISWQSVHDAIANVQNVTNVHDLHIWSISHGQIALSVHCTCPDDDALAKIHQVLLQFRIQHPTIQIQQTDGPCITCGEDHADISTHASTSCVSNRMGDSEIATV